MGLVSCRRACRVVGLCQVTINKFVVALAAFFGVVSSTLADGHLTNAEIGTLVSSLLGAILVYVVPYSTGLNGGNDGANSTKE